MSVDSREIIFCLASSNSSLRPSISCVSSNYFKSFEGLVSAGFVLVPTAGGFVVVLGFSGCLTGILAVVVLAGTMGAVSKLARGFPSINLTALGLANIP